MEQLGSIEISPELEAQFREHARKSYTFWKNFSSIQEKQFGIQQAEEFKNNPDKITAAIAENNEKFIACDLNGNGRLNYEEYCAFMNMTLEQAAIKGNFAQQWEGQNAKTYELYNQIDSSQEGFTQAEYFGMATKWMKMFGEIKAADEALTQ